MLVHMKKKIVTFIPELVLYRMRSIVCVCVFLHMGLLHPLPPAPENLVARYSFLGRKI